MRIESSPQARPEYRKTTASATPSKTFGQVMEATKAQDRYVPSTPQPRTEPEDFAGNRIYHGNVPVSNATHAKLKQLAVLNAQADYAGMSPDEILSEIWNRYDEAFDGNMVAITGGIAGPAEWCEVNRQFIDEINQHICYPEKRAAYQEAKNAGASGGSIDPETYAEKRADSVYGHAFRKLFGYEGMNVEETEAAIREKYAGKNTTSDFLKMQSELSQFGVLRHKMGDRADTYCAMLRNQFDEAFNPNSVYTVGHEKHSLMTADQWYRVANQPFDAAQFATSMKENVHQVSGLNDWTKEYVKMMEGFIDHFVTGAIDESLDSLLSETNE